MSESIFTELFTLEGKKGRTLTVYSNKPVTDLLGNKSLYDWENENVVIAIARGDYDLAKGMLATDVTRFNGNEEQRKAKLPGDARPRTYVFLERNPVGLVSVIDAAESYVLRHPKRGKGQVNADVRKQQIPTMTEALNEVQNKWVPKKHSRFNRNRPTLGTLL